MNWPVLVIVGIVLIALMVFMIRRNLTDEKEFEENMNKDYRKPSTDSEDVNVDEVMK